MCTGLILVLVIANPYDHDRIHRFSKYGHPQALDACYVASCQLPRPDFHRLVDGDFQDTPVNCWADLFTNLPSTTG